jgi:hypothetical protein
MNPTRFDGSEPGALDRQQKRQQTNSAILFGSLVISADPATEPLTLMPAGVIPDNDDHTLSFLARNGQQALQEGPGRFTLGLSFTDLQINGVRIVTNSSITC